MVFMEEFYSENEAKVRYDHIYMEFMSSSPKLTFGKSLIMKRSSLSGGGGGKI